MHTPLTREGQDATYHLAGREFFARLKQGAVFINTSRGKVHDNTALRPAMESGKLGAVVLDVWENEPTIDPWLLRNVDLSTPHIAGYSFDGKVAGLIMIYEAACRHFGITPTKTMADFLPAPDVAQIMIDPTQLEMGLERVIHDTVQQVYVINRDDFNTREILLVPECERGAFFDALRKNYPVRREFQNTRVIVPGGCDELANKLSGIGFMVGS